MSTCSHEPKWELKRSERGDKGARGGRDADTRTTMHGYQEKVKPQIRKHISS